MGNVCVIAEQYMQIDEMKFLVTLKTHSFRIAGKFSHVLTNKQYCIIIVNGLIQAVTVYVHQ